MKNQRTIISATLLTLIIVAIERLLSDTDFRVQLVHCCAVVTAFTIPALWVAGWDDLLKRPWLPIVGGIPGGLVFELGSMMTVSKYEPFTGIEIYLLMMSFSLITLAIHGGIAAWANKQR